jgi:aromatic ring-cleaving dioxygenase
VGHTRVDLARHPAPDRAAPVRLRAGAFPGDLPRRDLLLSPEHCLLIDGALVPAFLLVNGATIARQDELAEVTYWHVELDRHDVVLAEGLPAESYLDTGNRALFSGEAGVRGLHADLAGRPDAAALHAWRARGCAPLRLAAAAERARLRARALALGWTVSDRAGLVVTAAGRTLAADTTAQGQRVRVPPGTAAVRLLSDSFVPAELVPGSGDTRRLGVAVAEVHLAGWPLHPDALDEGWHAPRSGGGPPGRRGWRCPGCAGRRCSISASPRVACIGGGRPTGSGIRHGLAPHFRPHDPPRGDAAVTANAAVPASTDQILGWHAHIYYDPASRPRAEAGLAAAFPEARLGRWHDQPVGPHTQAMYQVAFPPALLPALLPWLLLNRRDLAVLLHPETGRDLADHTQHAAWLGEMLPLRLDVLQG